MAVDLRIYEAYIDVTYVEQPVCAITAPLGLVTDTNFPLTTWTNTLDIDGGSQARFEIEIWDSDLIQLVLSATVTAVETTWTPPTPLPNGNYETKLRIAQTVNGAFHWSDQDSAFWGLDVDPPELPAITVTPDGDLGHITLDLVEDDSAADTDFFEVQRSDDGGSTWTTLRTLRADDRVEVADGPSVRDFEAPIGVALLYRARSVHEYPGSQFAASDWVVSDPATLVTGWWLTHPTRPWSLRVAVEPHAFPQVARSARQGVHQAAGAARPVVITDTRTSWAGTITLRADSADDRADLDEILDVRSPLLLRGPRSHSWPDSWVVFGDQTRTRFVDKAFVAESLEALPFNVVDRPAGVLEGWLA